jgi:hypothetical protein
MQPSSGPALMLSLCYGCALCWLMKGFPQLLVSVTPAALLLQLCSSATTLPLLSAGINAVNKHAKTNACLLSVVVRLQEKWVYDNKTFNGFARHYKTGKPVPPGMFAKIKGSQTYRKGEAA